MERVVFINYRGEDSRYCGALLYRALTGHFGEDLVFLDCESIPAGADFVEDLLGHVQSARVLLAVIGQRWLTATDPATGRRRIDDPADWIRRELAEAFAAGVRVIPVLTDQAELPRETDLPADIAALSRCQYRHLRRRETTSDLARLVADLTALDPVLEEAARSRHNPTRHSQPPSAPRIPGWVVPRADELKEVVAAVLAEPGKAVGITTGLVGAGGFGKTMLAAMACADERVRQHFEGRIYIVTIGRDVRASAAIAMKVVETIQFITGHTATYTDPGMAGDELGRLLDQNPGRRILLVLDDMWEPAQLDPFLRGGKDCVRLVTTRVPAVLPDGATRVRVDHMTQDQARAVLGQDLQPLLTNLEHLVRDLIVATGRWPLLLRLANRWMWRQTQAGADTATAAEHMLTLLREEGPAAMDRSRPPPDPADPAQRSRLVRATLQAAIGLLTADEPQRLAELGIFAEDEPFPVLVAARLWQVTGELNESRSRDLCYELSSLSLLTVTPDGGGFLVLHSVIRDYLRHELGSDRITQLNATLTDAIAASLPAAEPLAASVPCTRAAWWALTEDPADSYLADHLIAHLLAADRIDEAEAVACDLRWVEARLHQQGSTAPWSDCARIPTATAERRARDLLQAAHLLAPTNPGHALTAVLHSRLGPLPQWRDQVAARQHQFTPAALRNHWPPPDLPNPAATRVLDHGRRRPESPPKKAMAVVAPDGSWLASADTERVRIWDVATGQQTMELDCHGSGGVWSLAVAPDGSWLATGHNDGQVRIWDVTTGQQTQILKWHPGSWGPRITVAPDGSWLAAGHNDGQVRIWDVATGQQTMELDCRPGWVWSLAVAPDGSWLASGTDSVRIWDLSTGQQIRELRVAKAEATTGPREPWMLRVGTWLATGYRDGQVQVWDVATGQQIRKLPDAGGTAAAATPDSTWLATSRDGQVRVWDLATGQQIRELRVAKAEAEAIAMAPDATWLATIGFKGRVQIWDLTTRWPTMELDHHDLSAAAVAVAPDGTWLASGHYDGCARIWDVATGEQIREFDYHVGGVKAVAVAPDGRWLATVCGWEHRVRIWDVATGRKIRELLDARAHAVAVASGATWLAVLGKGGRTRIWDLATGQQSMKFDGHVGEVTAVAVAPDGRWLATAGGDMTIRVWEKASGRVLTAMRVDGALYSCAWMPDGSGLVIGGHRGVYFFDFYPGANGA